MAKKDYAGGFRLTLKKARELALQEFGTAKGLEAEQNAPAGYFHMRFGALGVHIRPDIYGSGCIKIEVRLSGGYGTCTQYHDPETLQEKFEVEEVCERREKQDRLKEWVDDLGPELAHAAVDRLWNTKRW